MVPPQGVGITLAGRNLTPGQWLMTMGVAYYHRTVDRPACMSGASSVFDALVDIAKTRGFKDRRLMVAAMRKGKASPTALARCEEVCRLLTTAELVNAVDGTNWWLSHFSGRKA